MHPLQILSRLKASAPDAVVSEGADDDFLDRMYIPTDLDDWLIETVASALTDPGGRPYELIILAGNAGDGKSALIRRIHSGLRHEFPDIEDHLRANWDATHSNSPQESQLDILGRFFEPFSDASTNPSDKLHLIAMNTGMINGFFNSYHEQRDGHPDFPSLNGLATIVLGELGIPWDHVNAEPSPPAKKTLTIDLDKRNLLNFGQDGSSLFREMLGRVNPTEPNSLTFEAVKQTCTPCPVRESCFLYFNLHHITRDPVATNLERLLEQVYLAGDVHLSPRNVWDLLSHLSTGGAEGLIGPDRIEDDTCPLKRVIQKRYAHNSLSAADVSRLFFMYPHDHPETPLLKALAEQDPARFCSSALDVSVLRASLNPKEHPVALSNPLIAKSLIAAANGQLRLSPAAIVKRWTFFFNDEPELQSAFEEDWLNPADKFVAAATEYGSRFVSGHRCSTMNLFEINDMVKTALKISFGSRGIKDGYRISFHKQGRFIPMVQITDLRVVPFDKSRTVSESTREALHSMRWLPREIRFEAQTGNGSKGGTFFIDLGLYRLLIRINTGYNPTSFDLARFFHFRSFGERIGANALERGTREVIFTDRLSDQQLHVQEEQSYGTYRLKAVLPHV